MATTADGERLASVDVLDEVPGAGVVTVPSRCRSWGATSDDGKACAALASSPPSPSRPSM